MKFKVLIIFQLILFSLSAQTAAEGESLFNAGNYAEAQTVYEALLKTRPKDFLSNYRYARCCFELNDYETAITHFLLAGKSYQLTYFYLGESYYYTYRFEKSIENYKKYLLTLKADDIRRDEIEHKIEKAEKTMRFMNRVEDVAIVDSVLVDKSKFLQYYKFSNEVGKISQQHTQLDSVTFIDKITYITQRGDRKWFSEVVGGKLKLFSADKLLNNWSAPQPMPTLINTDANVNYPFFLLDGVTMYFASDDAENSMGGYDIFITKYSSIHDDYLQPENIGMPFNSPYNDYMLVIDEHLQAGWWATDRFQEDGKVIIYQFVPNEEKKIIHSDDKDYVRLAAQLKVYRKGEKSETKVPEGTTNRKTSEIRFVVNDALVYTDISQFKNKQALGMWWELNSQIQELESKKISLENLRREYSVEKDATKKEKLISQIVSAEQQLLVSEQQIRNKEILIRNEENKSLQR